MWTHQRAYYKTVYPLFPFIYVLYLLFKVIAVQTCSNLYYYALDSFPTYASRGEHTKCRANICTRLHTHSTQYQMKQVNKIIIWEWIKTVATTTRRTAVNTCTIPVCRLFVCSFVPLFFNLNSVWLITCSLQYAKTPREWVRTFDHNCRTSSWWKWLLCAAYSIMWYESALQIWILVVVC